MQISNGIDIIMITRLEKAYERQGEAFLKRVFRAKEIAYCTKEDGNLRWPSLAARFAAKEAFSKALGTGIARGVRLQDIEVLHIEDEKPEIRLHGIAEDIFKKLGYESISLSLSHDAQFAVASCVIYG